MTERTPTGDNVEFPPKPSILEVFTSDASPREQLADSFDNPIERIRVLAEEGEYLPDELNIDAEFHIGESLSDSKIQISDNAGGLERDKIKMLFQWGASERAQEGVSLYGIGSVRVAGMGSKIRYESRHWDADSGYGFMVDVDDLLDDDGDVTDETYKTEEYEVAGMDPGTTRVIVEDLDRPISEIIDIGGENDE